ncbi:HIT family protein [Chengkuizengella axinellae]|uniref:HIT domain-containing protein n=1 Tax=Chengkuizengella axinellae TaxID=3064388 RepID=A0ABT9IU63_9BACL|nr:HIT domain-containing protein [Chengkuizengella sp. 2205SS18-9]MDP5272871.1 HIT domain-containing protein [Chengkuizengella sp. 2205SS18-9]
MKNCPLCWPIQLIDDQKIIFETERTVFIMKPQEILIGSGLVIPKKHKETVFDLSEEEVAETFSLLKKVKLYLDKMYHPEGYNVGWNCMPVGGQSINHAHLHVIPRYKDEPLAYKGIRNHLKQRENKRPSL